MTDVEHDIDVLFVFEVAIEAHNILVLEWAMNLDLAGKLLTSFASSKVRLWDDFESPTHHALCLFRCGGQFCNFVGFCESTLHNRVYKRLLKLTLPKNLPFL